jgi:phosphatidylethanolamine/phosphatidyl-N-methylethanolamine N-methyltransferase
VTNPACDPGRLSDRLRFVRAFLCDPLHVGAVTPASSSLGDRIAAATRKAVRDGFGTSPYRNGAHTAAATHARPPIVELGAGTGSVSRFISAMNPVLVERNDEWAALLRKRFPYLEIRAECATLALANLSKPVGVVSSIPLLNNPQADAIRTLLTRKYRDGLIRFCVLYTYGWTDPLAGVGFREARREYFVTRSFPPASVWVYR